VSKKDRRKKRTRSSSGKLTGLRSGFKGLLGGGGGGGKKKESLASKIISWLLLAAALGLLIYKFTR
jgi:hypothetical protein